MIDTDDLAGCSVCERALKRIELLEAAARLLVAGWENTRGLSFARQTLEHDRLVDQLRSALEAVSSSPPRPQAGGDPPAGG